jgi:hypothetical protein
MSLAKETKRCPFCREVINVAAVRCKHCHADLTKQGKKKSGFFSRMNTFRTGFLSGILLSLIIAIVLFFQCRGTS